MAMNVTAQLFVRFLLNRKFILIKQNLSWLQKSFKFKLFKEAKSPWHNKKGKVYQILRLRVNKKCLIVFTRTRFIESDKKQARAVFSREIIEGENDEVAMDVVAFPFAFAFAFALPEQKKNEGKKKKEKSSSK